MIKSIGLKKIFFKLAKKVIKTTQLHRFVFYKILSYGQVVGKPELMQPLLAVGRGKIIFSKGVTLGVFPSPYYWSSIAYIEARYRGAVVSIGENTTINNGFVAIAEYSSIKIGKNVLIGTNVEIIDSNFHGVAVDKRNISCKEDTRSVEVCDNVFIGSNVRIMKGVSIGRDSVIGNGSYVISSIPSGVVASGNPAKVLRHI